jgi:acyl-CoA thioester hydrolase
MNSVNKPSSVYRTVVLESFLDSFGHVNNAVYMKLYEEARWDMITAGGYGFAEVQKYQQGPVIIDAHISFRKELHLREHIRIESRVTEVRKVLGKVEQVLFNQAGEVSSEALFTIGFFDMKLRKLIPPAPLWLKAIGWESEPT